MARRHPPIEIMDRDRYLELLADWLVFRDAEAVRAALGLGGEVLRSGESAALRERALDLVDRTRLDAIVADLSAAPAGARASRHLELVLDAASEMMTPEASARVVALRNEPVFHAGGQPVSFETIESWLALRHDPGQLAARVGAIERASALVGEAERERCRERRDAAAGRSLPPAWGVRDRARDRPGVAVEGWARATLEVALSILPVTSGGQEIPVWLMLPLRVGAPELDAGLPEPDPALATFLCERLGAQRLREQRVVLDLHDRAGKPARDLVVTLPGERGVLAARRPLGRLRDYRGQLRLLGRALCRAGLERARGIDRFRADPGLEALHGALLEGQLVRPSWHERVLGRIPAPAVLDAWRLQGIARSARLAAEVVAGHSGLGSACPGTPVTITAGRSAGLPMLTPEGVMPWSGPLGAAQDEFVGRIVAIAADDLLSRRWGSAWSLDPRAGALLRDLWAAGHPTLGAFCSDLGLDPPGVDAALEVWTTGAS